MSSTFLRARFDPGGAHHLRRRARVGDREPARSSAVSRSCIVALLLVSACHAERPQSRQVAMSRAAVDDLALRRYVAAGDRAYIIGTEGGDFPAMGGHIAGEMGGVWAPPIKLVDGYWLSVDGARIGPAKRFTTGLGFAQLDLPTASGDLDITRVELAPDDIPAILVGVTMTNRAASERSVTLVLVARSELLPVYPWDFGKPRSKALADRVSFESPRGVIRFERPTTPWTALIAGMPDGEAFAPTDQQGTTGGLRWSLHVPARGERTVWVAIAGSSQ